MPLPILQSTHHPSTDDLVRLFHRTELHWARHLGEEAALDGGTAIANAELPNVWEANRMLDGAAPPGSSPADVVAEADAHFASVGVRCAQWTMNPAAPAERTSPLVEHLTAADWRPYAEDILRLGGRPLGAVAEVGGLTIIPARASFRHARALAEDAARWWNEPQLTDAAMLHLDDPHYDSLLALKDGDAAGQVGVLAVGDLGLIAYLYIAEAFRRQGIGRTLMSRAMEICLRSLFRHVLLSVDPHNAAAQSLYSQLGFQKVGEIISYRAPWTAG